MTLSTFPTSEWDPFGWTFDTYIRTIAIPDETGTVLIFRHFDTFVQVLPEFARDIVYTLEMAGRHALLMGQRFIVLLQADNPQFSMEVGYLVQTNPREW